MCSSFNVIGILATPNLCEKPAFAVHSVNRVLTNLSLFSPVVVLKYIEFHRLY